METPSHFPTNSPLGVTLYSLEKLIEWKREGVKYTYGQRLPLYSLEKLIEWKLCWCECGY
ncbi:hypothetical protein C789_965 [Microcystis aeruginosa FACHB-905 = DIANCHI905]|uniref:Uncharacterized protein n=1 Tax=Microcystis aeruginosa PCC 7806SL TaxID=1903187 RepID=A0AB33C3R7_MICA7|nr:hypothetical protein BH695_3763 [Microcystis aeruginosa PCC 7806SL]ELS49254.1 hypothetical protein C789_965 [Microcystis aeruginosa FACHB-905 = DIANCHI905]